MNIAPLHHEIRAYLAANRLERKFTKQCSLFMTSPFHPSLKTELLEPKHMRIWSFRIDRKYRAIFFFREKGSIEILDVNNHYQS